MNVFLVTADGRLVTPALTGTILEGITRDSILTVAADLGLTPEERRITPGGAVRRHRRRHASSRRSPAGRPRWSPRSAAFKSTQGGVAAARERRAADPRASATPILDIQYGRVPDTHGWLQQVC